MLIFSPAVEKPIAPPSRIIATPVMESSPKAMAITTIMGANAMKWFTAWVLQITANSVVITGINRWTLLRNFPDAAPTATCNAPDIAIM